MTPAERSDPWGWRVVYGAALVLVVAFFLFSLRAILNPFLLFLLLALLLSPYSGTRAHLLMLLTSGLLTLVWLLQTTGFLLAPFFLALIFAYVLHPLVEALQRRGVPRSLAIVLLALPLLGLLALALFVGLPALTRQIVGFLQALPGLIETGVDWLERMRRELILRDLPYVDENLLIQRLRAIEPAAVLAYVEQHREALARRVWSTVLGAGRGLGTVLTVLGYVVLTPVLTFYLLRDWDRLTERMTGLVPRPRKPEITGFAAEYDRLLSRYLRGQLLAATTVGVLTGFGMWLVGFPYALLIGVVAGVFNLVPYLGLVVSLVPALIIALFSGALLASLLKIAVVFGVVQFLDGSVIGPRIVGESVGLHPVWVILALAVFGFFFGFVGLLLAIPMAVLLKLLLVRLLARYRGSTLFLGGHA